MTRALDGVRVVDLSEELAGPFAAKLLGDLGADVIKLEPPQGDRARRRGPFADDSEDPETSAPFLYANTSKRSVVIDPADPDDLALRTRLIDQADILFASDPEPIMAAGGLGYDGLSTRNPGLIYVSVTGFGSSGPYADWGWNHLTMCALGGFAHLCGREHRQPLQLGGSISETLAGSYAATAALVALRGRHQSGHGDLVDVSALEAALNMALLVVQRYQYSGDVGVRRADVGPSPSFILPTADGYVGANTLTQAQWEMMCQFFGRPELIEEPDFADGWSRMANSAKLAQELAQLTGGRDAEDVFHDAQTWRIPFGLIPTLEEVLELPPHRERGYLLEVDHPAAGRLRMPGVPWMFGEERPLGSRPPLLGEHTESVRAGGWSQRAEEEGVDSRAGGNDERGRGNDEGENGNGAARRPLEGVRVIDLSMFMSGPMTTLVFGDGGADVIKVESVQRIDGWRAGGADDDYFWELAPQFNWVNRNKHGVTLNLTDQRGSDIIRHLVADADVIVENYTPRVMGNFGLAWEQLREINPDLIMLSMPGFGLTGSWSHYTAFANTTEQMSGLPHLTGYPDDQPIFSGTTGGDPLAGVMGAIALLSALERRDRLIAQGQPGGCHIDLSQTETATAFLGDAITAYAISGHDPGRVANYHPRLAPHNTYLCADDRWIAVACESDAQFASLAALMGRPQWAGDDGVYADFARRDAAREEIDTAIADWTSSRHAEGLVRELQSFGIAAALVATGKDLLEDPHLLARGFFITQEHTYAGVKRYPLQPYRFTNWAGPETDRPSPTLGRDTREVLARLTSLTPAEIDQLEADDVTGTIPLAARGD